MSMSTYVTGFVLPNDETYKKHVKVLEACLEADIEKLPEETAKYFDCSYPSKRLIEEKLTIEIPIHENNIEAEDRLEILVSEIPKGVHKIRFTNSY